MRGVSHFGAPRYDPAMPFDAYTAVLEKLGSSRRVLLATHVKPDGDAIGSVAAMAAGLQRKGIEARVLLFNPLPAKYVFLLEENQVSYFNVEKGWPADMELNSFDTLLVLDTGTWSQLPGLKEILKAFRGAKLVVDHHLTQEDWADLKLVETAAAAAGEIVADLLEQWGVTLDQSIAIALFMAIATDTGWFQFSNTRPKTLRLAAKLIEVGVDTDRLYRMVYQNERPQRLALMSCALNSLELLCNGRLAMMGLTKEDFAKSGADGSDTESLINVPMQVSEVEVSVLAVQLPEGGPIRVSLRSKGAIDVAAFAQRFKGGGHARAAGLKLDGEVAEARAVLGDELTAALRANGI